MHRAAILLISILLWLAAAAPAAAVICASDTVPAATLLLPYFEVDINNPNGVNTLFSIENGSAQAILTHVEIWTDLAVPVFHFHIYLTGYDMQIVNLRDIVINGNLPQTASAGQDPNDTISPKGPFSQDISFANCNGVLPPPPLPSIFIAHLQAALTGKASTVLGGLCAGQNLGDDIARGYITIDTVNNCTPRIPGDVGYFAAGGTGDVTNQNVLWGDWALVAPNTPQGSQGGMLVHIEADATNPATSTSGRYTFYGSYDNFTAVDNREPLATNFAVRYFDGAPSSGGTSYLVWRDPKVAQPPFTCPAVPGVRPPWYPLGQEAMVVFDEQENPSVVTTVPASPAPPGSTVAFGAAAQRVQVGSASLPLPFSRGWMFVDLNTHVAQAAGLPPFDSGAAQGWIIAAHADFSLVTTDAARFDSACAPQHFSVPPGVTGFFTVPPCRLVDTRNPAGPYGGPALAGGSGRSFDLAGLCGIPPTAKAVSLNVTVTAPTGSGGLTLFQGGIAQPNTSAISFSAGQTRANNAVIGVTQDGHGTLAVGANMPSGMVDLIVDVNGYFQ